MVCEILASWENSLWTTLASWANAFRFGAGSSMIRRGRAQDLMQARREPGSDLPRTPHGFAENPARTHPESGADALRTRRRGRGFLLATSRVGSRASGWRTPPSTSAAVNWPARNRAPACPARGPGDDSRRSLPQIGSFPAGGGDMAAPMPGMAEDRGACRAIPRARVSK